MSVQLCAGCSSEIGDSFVYNIIGSYWHAECVKCCICQRILNDRCYTKSNRLYCREDYFRRHGFDCSGCHQTIHASDFVRKINNQKVFHLSCLICSRCGRTMNTGEDVYIVSTNEFNEQLLCYQDYVEVYTLCSQTATDSLVQSNQPGPVAVVPPVTSQEPMYQSPGSIMSTCNDSSGGEVYRQADSFDFISSSNTNSSRPSSHLIPPQSPKDSDESDCSINPAELSIPPGPYELPVSPNSKDKADGSQHKRGPRTTIKTRQLQLLSEAFLSCQKPSKQMREDLARETGLSTRVIQVWFQNRRSKERRSLNTDGKQDTMSSAANFIHDLNNRQLRQQAFYTSHPGLPDSNQFMDPHDEK